MRKPLRAVVLGLGITTSGWAQTAAPAEKAKAPPAKAVAPKANEPSQARITINGAFDVESLMVRGEFPGTLELNNVTVNDLIMLIEKLRFEEEALDTYVIREDAGKVTLPRIVTQKKGLKEILENLPSIEPKLGVEQLPQGGYVILLRETGTPKEEKTFAAFGLKEYLNKLAVGWEGDSKAKEDKRERAIQDIKQLIEDSFELQGINKDKNNSQVSIRIHPSTGVLLATGTPKQLTVIRTTLQALGIPGSVSGGTQDWGPPRYAPPMSGGGGMMGGGMGGGAMGGGFGAMGVAPALPVLPGSPGVPASPYPGTPNSMMPYGGGGFPGSAPAATSPAKPATAPKKPGSTAPATPAAPTAPAKPASPVDGVPQVVSPERP